MLLLFDSSVLLEYIVNDSAVLFSVNLLLQHLQPVAPRHRPQEFFDQRRDEILFT